MSAPNRRARRTAERELRRLERRLATDPNRPILRAAERSSPLPPGGGPGRGGDSPIASAESQGGPDPTVQAAQPLEAAGRPPHPGCPPADASLFPLWARLLSLPPDLDPTYRAFLFRYIEDTIAPRDDHEHWLAARIATAMARLHLNARREPENPSAAWLRYEALADRQLRQAHRDLDAHRKAQPAPTGNSRPATTNHPTPQTPPRLHDPTFARTISPPEPPAPVPLTPTPVSALARPAGAPPGPS